MYADTVSPTTISPDCPDNVPLPTDNRHWAELEAKIPAHFTPAQRQAVIMAATTNANLSLRSTAGSGKSTVIRVMAQVIDPAKRIVALAFNNTIEKELKLKLPENVETRTSHGFCKDALEKAYGKLGAPNQFKRNNLVREFLKEVGVKATTEQLRDLTALSHMALLTMTPPTEEALQALVTQFGYSLPSVDLVECLKFVTGKSKEAFLERREYDFTDLLYLVPALNVLPGTVDVMLVDESQDFSALQRKVVEHFLGYRSVEGKKGRLICVGDPEQSIYIFTGAASDSMSRMEELFESEVLALDLSFRCPKSHIRVARLFSDVIQAPETAIEGEVKLIPEMELAGHIKGGELIMSRNRAPLVSFALNLISSGKEANLIGADLSTELGKHLKSALTIPFTPAEVGPRLQERARELLAQYRQQKLTGKALQKRLQNDADLLSCAASIATRVALDSEEGVGTLADIDKAIAKMSSTNDNATQLCTVHKAKGLEAKVSIILRPEDLKTGEDATPDERCVNFVAMTRGKEQLIFAPKDPNWQPWEGVELSKDAEQE